MMYVIPLLHFQLNMLFTREWGREIGRQTMRYIICAGVSWGGGESNTKRGRRAVAMAAGD